MALERRAPSSHHTAPNLDSGIELRTDPQNLDLWDLGSTKGGPLTGADSLFFLTGRSSVKGAPLQDDFKAHQELWKRMALNLELQVEIVKEYFHRLVDILAAVKPSKVALPLNEDHGTG